MDPSPDAIDGMGLPSDGRSGTGGGKPVRVVIVDDSAEVRLLLRITFSRDARFLVVGEAANGSEAIQVVGAVEPDMVLLDRQMPVMDGLQALPELRRSAPRAAVMLYTAGLSPGVHEAAVASGAVGVVDKATVGDALTDEVSRRLVEHWSGAGATLEVRVGPTSSLAARTWVDNTRCIVRAIREHPDVLESPVPPDVLDLFDRFLDAWGDVTAGTDRFLWRGQAAPEEVRRIVEYWAVIDGMSDSQLAALGCSWSPPQGQPFFHALTEGVLQALAAREETRQLAANLERQWRPGGPEAG